MSNQIILKDWDGHKMVLKQNDISELDYDIVLDTIGSKLYINKKSITSKELYSQRMTLDILKLLLLRIGEDVQNSDLPNSSYAQSKNEMQGKIITPLAKLVLERIGKKIALSCKGSNTLFHLKLNKSDFKLAAIMIEDSS